jgi:hypothetical protein
MATRKQYPVKLLGTTSWIGGPDEDVIIGVPVKRAIIRSNSELVLDCQCDTNRYDVSLKSRDQIGFHGTFVGRSGSNEWPVEVQAKLYSNAGGYLLFGSWLEDGGEYLWLAELWPVEAFPDEVR